MRKVFLFILLSFLFGQDTTNVDSTTIVERIVVKYGLDKVVNINKQKIVDELIANADTYFWEIPRQDTIDKIKASLTGDTSGVTYLIENARTRIYSAQRDYVIKQLKKLGG